MLYLAAGVGWLVISILILEGGMALNGALSLDYVSLFLLVSILTYGSIAMNYIIMTTEAKVTWKSNNYIGVFVFLLIIPLVSFAIYIAITQHILSVRRLGIIPSYLASLVLAIPFCMAAHLILDRRFKVYAKFFEREAAPQQAALPVAEWKISGGEMQEGANVFDPDRFKGPKL